MRKKRNNTRACEAKQYKKLIINKMKSTDMPYTKFGRHVRIREFTGNRINNTRRVERVLRLIKFLSNNRSIKEISKHLDIHPKSVNRYLNLMVQLGFEVEVRHKKYSYYRINNIKEYFETE